MREFAGRGSSWEADVIGRDHGHYLKAQPILSTCGGFPTKQVGHYLTESSQQPMR